MWPTGQRYMWVSIGVEWDAGLPLGKSRHPRSMLRMTRVVSSAVAVCMAGGQQRHMRPACPASVHYASQQVRTVASASATALHCSRSPEPAGVRQEDAPEWHLQVMAETHGCSCTRAVEPDCSHSVHSYMLVLLLLLQNATATPAAPPAEHQLSP